MDGRKQQRDVHREITEHIVAAIERGARIFEMPWHYAGAELAQPTNAKTRKPYHGVNTISLWASASARSFLSCYWATYRQWQTLDAQVIKGEKASLIVFYKEITKEVKDDATGKFEEKSYLMARASWVFNANQVRGWQAPVRPEPDPVEALEEADAFIACTGAQIRYGGLTACYMPSADAILVPDRQYFTGTWTSSATEGYYATLLHELTHWTAHASRLDRDLSGRFGSDSYAMEELIAELGAAFLCSELSIANAPREDHAAYVASWVKILKSDTRAIFTAASKASAAVRYLAECGENVNRPRRFV